MTFPDNIWGMVGARPEKKLLSLYLHSLSQLCPMKNDGETYQEKVYLMAPRKGPEASPSPTDANRRVFNGGGGDCCPGVADPYTLLSVLGTIGATTFLLRNAILQNINGGRRRRRRDVGNGGKVIRLRSGQKKSPSLFIEFLVFKRHKKQFSGGKWAEGGN